MKKYTARFLFAAIFAAMMMGGCGKGPPPTATPSAPTSIPPTSKPTTPPPTPAATSVPQGKTILVTSAADSGPGSLRQALQDAEQHDTITFDTNVFPPGSPVTIYLTSGLPELTQGNLTIDASDSGVILDGSKMTTPDPIHGLSISSNNNTIRGLQLVSFSDAGIALHSGAQHNIIGGERSTGAGPLGQGNLLVGNGNFGIGLWGEGTSFNVIQGNYIGIDLEATATWGHPRDGIHSNGANDNLITGNLIGGNDTGVYLCCVAEGRNRVTDNIIGTDASGTISLGNRQAGVLIDRTGNNMIGPGNIIAHNDGAGIMFWGDTPRNTITQNSIYDNGGQGIGSDFSSNVRLDAPLILDFDLQAGSLAGLACSNCTIEIFSDNSDEGAIYEGQATADSSGVFAFSKGSSFTGPHLTAAVSDPEGNTSQFSLPTSGASLSVMLQKENDLPRARIVRGGFTQLADNRIGDMFPLDRHSPPCPPAEEDWSFTHLSLLGLKWARLSLDRLELDQARDMGDYSQFEINACQDEMVSLLAENDISILYTIVYWDEGLHAESYPDYRNEDEIQRFLDYTRLIVRHFKDHIQYYEILNEALVYVEPIDYINLIRRVAPIIRDEYPQAKIVVGGSSNLLYKECRDYLFAVLRSDIMPLVDGVALHPMYGASSQYDDTRQYYEGYPSLVQEIKDVASDHGFAGEFIAEEMAWRTTLNPNPYEPWEYTPTVAAKYYARGIMMHLGMDLWAGIGGENYDQIPPIVKVVQNLSASMAGAKPAELAVEIQSEAANIMSFGFSLPDGEMLLALWTNGAAIEDDPGVSATLTFPGLSAQKVVGIDVLNGFEQEMLIDNQDDNLLINNLLVKDYPILLRLIP